MGFTFALGGGATYGLSERLKIRGDLVVQSVSQPFLAQEEVSGPSPVRVATNYSGVRVWLTAGVEFGL